jgi:glycosyltransferase 2 family protein
MTGGRRRALGILKSLLFLLCIALFAYALAQADLAAGWRRIVAIGPIVVVVLIPFPLALACDALGWRRLLRSLGHRVPWGPLFKVRIATEAVTNTTPAGAVWAEAVSPVLVARRTGAPVPDVVAASTAKRWLLVRMHAAYVTLAAAFGYVALSRASHALVGSDAIFVVVVAGAAGLVLLSLGVEAVTARGQIAGRVSGFLGRRRLRGLQHWIEGRHHHFTHADAQIAKVSADVHATRVASAWILGLWLLEGIETYVILHLLGARLGIIEVMSFDAALSVVRSAAVFAPAGIGVQDVGYLAVLEAYGVPGASGIAPAFIVLKRMKEALWVAIGFVLIARTGAHRRFAHHGAAHPPSAAT